MQKLLNSLSTYLTNPVSQNEESLHNTYSTGQKETRPWGSWEVLAVSENICIKRILVNPQGVLSLQYHMYRKEAWFFSSGIATVTLNGKTKQYSQGDSLLINEQEQHRLSNDTDTICELIEIQFGEYLKEDDIIRLEDKYGRENK